jgi:hypothetical protein
MREADKSIHRAAIGCGISRTAILGPGFTLASPWHSWFASSFRIDVRIEARSSQGWRPMPGPG